MNRSEFLQRTSQWACGSCAALLLAPTTTAAAEAAPVTPVDEALRRAQADYQFTNNWLADLFDAIEVELDRPTQLKLLESCGRGCLRRHRFKLDIVEAGRGDVDKLLAAYRKNFGISREGDLVHITYGREKNSCFCPAAGNRPAHINDLHCECTRASHEAIFAAALDRPIQVELIETVRRGGQRCHLVAHLS